MDTIPAQGARPADVRVAAWRHAHRAHVLATEATELRDRWERTGVHDGGDPMALESEATAHATVALALLEAGGARA